MTEEQTEAIFDTSSFISKNDELIQVDDLNKMKNHFKLFDYMLNTLDEPLSKELIIKMNKILKRGTSDEDNPRYNIGGFKVIPNVIGLVEMVKTSSPQEVENDLNQLLKEYSELDKIL